MNFIKCYSHISPSVSPIYLNMEAIETVYMEQYDDLQTVVLRLKKHATKDGHKADEYFFYKEAINEVNAEDAIERILNHTKGLLSYD